MSQRYIDVYSITLGNVKDENGNVLLNGAIQPNGSNPLADSVSGLASSSGAFESQHKIAKSGNVLETSAVSVVSAEYSDDTASLMVYDPDAETAAISALNAASGVYEQSQVLSGMTYDEETGELAITVQDGTALHDVCELPLPELLKQAETIRGMSALILSVMSTQ